MPRPRAGKLRLQVWMATATAPSTSKPPADYVETRPTWTQPRPQQGSLHRGGTPGCACARPEETGPARHADRTPAGRGEARERRGLEPRKQRPGRASPLTSEDTCTTWLHPRTLESPATRHDALGSQCTARPPSHPRTQGPHPPIQKLLPQGHPMSCPLATPSTRHTRTSSLTAHRWRWAPLVVLAALVATAQPALRLGGR